MNLNCKCCLTMLLAVALSSCNFSEDECPQYGYLLASCKQENGYPKVDSTDRRMLYLPRTGIDVPRLTGAVDSFRNDTLFRKLAVGIYDLITFNQAGYKLKNLTEMDRAEIYTELRTDESGNVYVPDNGRYCETGAMETVEILRHRNTETVFQMKPLVKRLVLTFNLQGYVEDIDSINCQLEGIATGKLLWRNKVGEDYAPMRFKPSELPADNNRAAVVYQQDSFVFGWNAGVHKKLQIKTFHEPFGKIPCLNEVDLSYILDEVKEDQVEIVLDVYVANDMGVDRVHISGWKEGEIYNLWTYLF